MKNGGKLSSATRIPENACDERHFVFDILHWSRIAG